jgi:2-polyprenyl-3-methyl-5-hydroxy-6-metoxy-1,4-benzoquinol methylase
VRAPASPRNCPVCGASRKELLFRQIFSPAVEGNFLSGYDVVTCLECGFGFADGLPSQADFEQYYREMSKYEYGHRGGEETPDDLGRFRDIADGIEKFLQTTASRILEIGCATGSLLALLRADGYPRVEGLDPSPACASAAQRLHGIAVRTTSLSEIGDECGNFDMVILVGVLEHLVDLGPALDRVRRLCEPSGRVYVEVPDATRFADCLDAPFQQFSMEHVGFFSAETLERLMALHRFRTLSSQQTVRAHTQNSRMPVVWGVFEAAPQEPRPAGLDSSTATGLAKYVARCREAESRLLGVVNRLAESREPVIVWGLGTLTRRLLATSRLDQANIHAFVDSNPHYHGKSVNGVPVIAPEDVRSRSETIVIASLVFRDEIARQIKDELRCPNKVVSLFP